MPVDKVDDNRLYRGLDELLPHKQALEVFLKQRFGELFAIEYDLLLYDVTSTYFEGQANANPLAQRGYSRDHRPDCKQVCIGLVVTRCGLPLGYEVFAGNRHDSTTLGRDRRDDGSPLRPGPAHLGAGSRHGLGREPRLPEGRASGSTSWARPRASSSGSSSSWRTQDWHAIRDGLEVKLCPCPDGGAETFILCRSRDRREKEQAMHARFEKRIEEGLTKIAASCAKRRQRSRADRAPRGTLAGTEHAGRGLVRRPDSRRGKRRRADRPGRRSRSGAPGRSSAKAPTCCAPTSRGWSDEDLWRAYIQLTDAETAFRIQKSDLSLRPVWHQKEDRVLAHILVCFLAYVLWKFLGQLCQQAGLGNEPRRVLDELSELRAVDVVLPTKDGHEIRTRCVTQPSDHQKILLERLGLKLPGRLQTTDL